MKAENGVQKKNKTDEFYYTHKKLKLQKPIKHTQAGEMIGSIEDEK